jgi:hypothetical protein
MTGIHMRTWLHAVPRPDHPEAAPCVREDSASDGNTKTRRAAASNRSPNAQLKKAARREKHLSDPPDACPLAQSGFWSKSRTGVHAAENFQQTNAPPVRDQLAALGFFLLQIGNK